MEPLCSQWFDYTYYTYWKYTYWKYTKSPFVRNSEAILYMVTLPNCGLVELCCVLQRYRNLLYSYSLLQFPSSPDNFS